MLIKESMLRRIIREEAIKSLREQTGGYLSAGLATAGVAAPIAAGYRGYQNMQTREAGLGVRFPESQNNQNLAELEKAIRNILYGQSATSAFFNMTADAGMFAKDLYFGEGGDFADMSEESKEKIVKATYLDIQSGKLDADVFHKCVVDAFKADPGTADESPPEKEAGMTTQGTDTYFAMLSTVQSEFLRKQKMEADTAKAADGAGANRVAKNWKEYISFTSNGGQEVANAWAAYAQASGTNPGFGTFARWYQANATNLNPQQTIIKLKAATKAPVAAAPAAPAAAAPAVAESFKRVINIVNENDRRQLKNLKITWGK